MKRVTNLLLSFCLLLLGLQVQAQKSFSDHLKFKGVAVEEPGYFLWGASPIEDEDGKIHLFVARWKTEHTFDVGWRSHSEIAHYVSNSPEGPFKFSDLALGGTGKDTWDKYGIHNPAIHKVGNKYVLLYISNNNYRQPPHPSNQCIGMMTADSPYGPWKKVGKDGMILAPSTNPEHWTYKAANGVNNPAFLQHPNGGFLLYFKSQGGKMGVAFAENVEGPYVMFPKPVTKNNLSIEDGYAFNWNGKICLLTTDNHGIMEKGGGILWKSENGIDFDEHESGFHVFPAYLPKGALDKAKQNYGPMPKFERPQVLMRDGQPAYLYVPSGANMYGKNETLVHVLKYENQFPATPQEDDLNLTAMIQPADSTSFFKDENYYNWCNSIVKDENGLYHLFYARFPKRIGFFSWLTHSKIAHAVSDRPEGPYRNCETLMKPRADKWDQIALHNVKVSKFGDQYYLYYTATNSEDVILSNEMLEEIGRTGYSHKYWNLLRKNQRTGVAVSSSINGPWKRFDKALIQPHGAIKTITVNPSACQGADGKYYMIVKGDALDKPGVIQAISTSDSPTGPFKLENKPAFDDIPTEDVCMWFDKTRARFYAIFHAHKSNFIGLITSEDGVNWQKAKHYEVCKKQIPMKDGSVIKVDRMERPNIYIENNKPVVLSFAVKKGNDAYVVFFKLSDEIVSMK